MSPTWHLIAGEYPFHPGGVGDYTRAIACGLAAAGEDVEVWAPRSKEDTAVDSGVNVHRLPGHYDLRSLHVLAAALNAWPRPSRLLVQYVPHSFGWKAMNVGFARWLTCRRQPVWMMFHEVAFPWFRGQSLKHQLVGCVTRRMAAWAAGIAERNFVSTPPWETTLREIVPGNPRIDWLPVPSNLPVRVEPQAASRWRMFFNIPASALVIGHFGTYGKLVSRPLIPVVTELLRRNSEIHFLFLGRSSNRYAANFSESACRVHGTGELLPRSISECIDACDLLLQPFPDGISCRRGSVMAALALGKPVVSTVGTLSEPLWVESGAVALAEAERPMELVRLVEEVMIDETRRNILGQKARQLYSAHFSVERSVNILLGRESPMPLLPKSA